MYKAKIFFFLLCGMLMGNLLWAQGEASLSGRVLDAQNKPADAASIVLRTAADSVIVKMMLSDEQGHFVFDKLEQKKYKISVSLLGYLNYNSDTITLGAPELVLPSVVLQQSQAQLNEVSVVAKKSFIERKADRTIVNVDALIGNAGTNALEVLEKSPGVRVDQNGSISLKGKDGVLVLIDDKPTYMSGTDLQNYLRSLPSSTLDQIELMPNPPARYDAAGSAGVINIKTKQNKTQGLNGSLNLGYNQGRYARSNNSLNLSYRKEKVSVFANLAYSRHNGFNDLDINRRYKNADESTQSYFIQNTYIRSKADALNAKTGLDFYLDTKNTLGIQFNGQATAGLQNNNNVSNILNAFQRPDSVIKAMNTEKNTFKNGGINMNYRHQFNEKGKELTADMDYIAYRTGNNQVFNNNGFLPDGSATTADKLTGALPAQIDIYSFKTDYTHPLAKGYILSAGAKATSIRTDNKATYDHTSNNITLPDYDKSNHFIYREKINAAYINLNKEYKKVSLQGGLRLENTVSQGHQLGNIIKPDSAFSRHYTNLFPTLSLGYKVDSAGNHQFSFNYGRRINRPYYQDLNPFISPLDKFTYYVGNPFLRPSFTDNLELSYTFHNKVTATASYANRANEVNETIEIQNGIYYSRPGNIGNVVVKTFSIDANIDPFRWLSFHCYTEVSNIHSVSNFYTGKLNTQGTYWFIQPIFQFKLGKGWGTEILARYITDVTNAQFISGANGNVNAGVQKVIGDKATLKFTVNDIFYTAVNKGRINNLAYTDATYNNRFDSRQFMIAFAYRFGKGQARERRHSSTGAESEKERVKQ